MTKLSDMLVYLRKRSGLSQMQLADELGMTRSAISMYETGKREPTLEGLEAFADFYNVDMNTLTGGKDTSSSVSPTPTLNNVYLSFAQEAQDKNIDPEDIREALELIEKLKHKRK